MNDLLQTVDELRRMSAAELTQVGEDSLKTRLREQALEALDRHGRFSPGNLETVLNDRDTVRHPTRLVLEFGEMGMHQFAQPEKDIRNPGGVMLYLRPTLGKRPDLICLAVSYMIPLINYGPIISDEHAIEYGSTLMNMGRDEYYAAICEMADFSGARALTADDPDAHQAAPADQPRHSCSCGGGGSCGST